jgi:VWFA-related protein
LRIYDDGKLMQAVFCRPLETAERPSTLLGPGEYSNRPTGSNWQSILVLLDLLNANFAERGQGWNELGRTFQKLESGEHFYVYLLTKEGTFYPIHALPGAESPASPGDADWAAQVPSLLDQAMHNVNRLRPWEFQVNPDARIGKTIAALRDLASDFAAQPGRKSLVWISHGVPIDATGPDGLRKDYMPVVMGLGTDLARSGIAVYAMDQQEHATPGMDSADSLQEIAALTAGKWFPGNSVEKAIQQAVSDGHAAYQVGYIPPLDRWDNKFHKLRVTAATKGVRLRATEGYFGDVRQADATQRLALATFGQADDPGIGIRATTVLSEKVKGWSRFQIRVDAADLRLTPGEAYIGEFAVTLAYYTTEWQPDASQEVAVKLHLTPAEHDTAMRDGVSLSVDRPVPAGARKVRIVVRDNQSGAVGSLSIPVAASPEA